MRTTANPTPADAPYDLLITNARILDGAGNPWYRGEIAVRGDRIVAVGARVPAGAARRTIDAGAMIVSPGFIDVLGHSELSILRTPGAISKISQGITSEVTGEVNSAWPTGTAPGETQDSARSWRSLDDYFRALERLGPAINLGTYVAAGSVRREVMGDLSRDPTEIELAMMEALVDSAMRDGAMGFSTGLIYTPSTFFTEDHLVRLARVAARHGGGYASHIRSEGNGLLDAIGEAIRIGERAGTWTQIRHLKAAGEANWGRMTQAVALIDSARRRGLDVTADQYPYTASGTGLSAILPVWVHAGGTDSMLARLGDSTSRRRLREGSASGEWGGRPASTVLINAAGADSLSRYEGIRLDSVGLLRGQEPFEAAYDILLADRGRTSAIFFSMSEADVRLAMRQPWVMFGQDAGASAPDTASPTGGRGHPRGYGTFPRILGRYVRDDAVLSLEEAIRKMTSLPAARLGIADRGLIRAGMYADLVIFDPATVIDRATFARPRELSTGIIYVAVNGVLVIDSNRPTGARPGRALRGAGWNRGRR